MRNSRQISIRVDTDTETMMAAIDTRLSSAAKVVVETFKWLRESTIGELRGKFTRREILALAEICKGSVPDWKYLTNPLVFVFMVEDA